MNVVQIILFSNYKMQSITVIWLPFEILILHVPLLPQSTVVAGPLPCVQVGVNLRMHLHHTMIK